MSIIITPKNIIEILVEGSTTPSPFSFWENKLQERLFKSSLGSLAVGGVAALCTHIIQTIWLPWVALAFLVTAQLGGLLYQLSVALPTVKMLKHSEKTLASPVVESFNADIERITELARDFDQHHLNYARDRFALISEQLRQRLALMIGAIDKVGVLPSAVAGFFTFKEALNKAQFSSSGLEAIFWVLIFFYVLAAHLTFVSQRLEQATLILKHAASKKELDDKASKSDR